MLHGRTIKNDVEIEISCRNEKKKEKMKREYSDGAFEYWHTADLYYLVKLETDEGIDSIEIADNTAMSLH